MRHYVIASVVTGSVLVAAGASAQQQQPGYTTTTPAPSYQPAPVQPAPSAQPPYGQAPPAAQPAPSQQQPQYGQPAAQPQQQPQYAPPQPQYAPQQQPQPQYAPQQQPQPQYAPQQQPPPGYGGSASYSSSPSASPDMTPIPGPGSTWRPANTKVILAGERMFGFSYLTGALEPSGSQAFSGNATMVSLLWANSTVRIAGVTAINPYSVPMLSIHGVVGPGVTVGGGLGYASTAGSHEDILTPTGGKTDVDDPTRTAFIVAPRVGYLLSTSSTFGVWFKGGVTYSSQKQELNRPSTTDCSTGTCFTIPGSSSSVTISAVAMSFDTMFVLAPVPHVGILFGPTADIGVAGTMSEEASGQKLDTDLKISNFGIAAGLALLI
jgi:hypothetical protein